MYAHLLADFFNLQLRFLLFTTATLKVYTSFQNYKIFKVLTLWLCLVSASALQALI